MANALCCAGVSLALLLSGCDAPDPPLRIATIQWIGYQPLHLAAGQGYFGANRIRLADFNSNTESLRAFRNGDVEVAALTLDEVLLLRADGHDARVILVLDYSEGGDAVVSRPEVENLAALRGKRVGVESSAAGAYFLTRALETAGLAGTDVEIVNVGAELQEHAYLDGRADAFVTFEPIRTRLLKHGAHELFNSRQTPGEIVDVLVARGETIVSRHTQLDTLIDGWFRAVRYAATDPDAAALQVAPHLELALDDYRLAMAGMRFPTLEENCALLRDGGQMLRNTVARLHAVMLKTGLLPSANPPGEVFDARVLERQGCSESDATAVR